MCFPMEHLAKRLAAGIAERMRPGESSAVNKYRWTATSTYPLHGTLRPLQTCAMIGLVHELAGPELRV